MKQRTQRLCLMYVPICSVLGQIAGRLVVITFLIEMEFPNFLKIVDLWYS